MYIHANTIQRHGKYIVTFEAKDGGNLITDLSNIRYFFNTLYFLNFKYQQDNRCESCSKR